MYVHAGQPALGHTYRDPTAAEEPFSRTWNADSVVMKTYSGKPYQFFGGIGTVSSLDRAG
jgi:hypothetical protein